ARDHGVALLQAVGRQDVALLAVGVEEQRDARRAVRIVLDLGDLGRHADLVAPKIDHAVAALVAAAAEPRRDAAVMIAAAARRLGFEQRALRLVGRDLREVAHHEEAATGERGFELADAHLGYSFVSSKNWISLPSASVMIAFLK